MSLRGKIVLLFFGLSVLPILVVAGYGYQQTKRMAREVVGVSLETSVSQATRQLRQAAVEVEASLGELVGVDDPAQLRDEPGVRERWEAAAAAMAVPLAYVTLRGPDGTTLARAGNPPPVTERCTAMGGSRLVTFERAGEGAEIEAGVWMDDLVSPRGSEAVAGGLMIFDLHFGRVLLSSDCDDLEGTVPAEVRVIRPSGGRAEFELGGQERLAYAASLDTRPWTVVVHARSNTVLGPLQQLQASYWIFVLMLALATVLAFSMLLDQVVLSLEDLTNAAARIGEGELNPWLPPPGDDEVGRLSLAFSGMLERIRQMMQHIDHSGRLAVVGQLTSYLAHEIRNPLSSIRMNLQSLQRDVRRGRIPADAGEAVDISLREVDRLSSSLTSVLQLGRSSPGERETVSVHDVVEDAAGLLTGEFGNRDVDLVLELDATADQITAATGQLKGVFLNLMMNALEAQPDGGRVEVRSRLVSARGGGPTVAVHVRDFGRGVPPELRHRIFEPFFTTKSQGSGIGLAVALRIVREHGGDLFLAELPETAAGAELVVELPLAAVVQEIVPAPADLPEWMGSGATSERSGRRWASDHGNLH